MVPALVLPDGRRVELDDDVVLGRAPIAPEYAPAARSISLSVPTVSKTHVLVGHDADGVWLVDLDSSNGSEVLDAGGMSERAVPGRRMSVPAGSHIRVGTDTIITIDSGAAAHDDADRTVVVRPGPQTPVSPPPPPSPPPSPPSPSPPQPSPPPPPPSPPPTVAAPTQTLAAVPGAWSASAPHEPTGPSYGSAAAPPTARPMADRRSMVHLIGALLVLVWSAVGFADLRGWIPKTVSDAVDGRLLDFFFVPSRTLIEFFEFFSVVTLPESLSFLSRGADIGPVIAILVAVVALVAPTRVVRWTLVALIVIPLVLQVGIVVTLLVDEFDFFIDDIDRFIPWFILPGVAILLLMWPRRRPSSAPTPPHDVFYAPVQSPGSPSSGPGAPPFS